MKLILLGAPGAGKGTQAEQISEKHGIPMISTGALLREAMKNGTETGLAAKSYIDKGELVPDGLVIALLQERLSLKDCENGFILDGFPRNVAQAQELEKMGIAVDAAVSIEVPDEEIIDRLSGRRVCSSCAASYHVRYKPTREKDKCDKCGGALTLRQDDHPDTVKNRLNVFHEQTEPLKEYYLSRGKLKIVIGQEEVADTTREMNRVLDSIK